LKQYSRESPADAKVIVAVIKITKSSNYARNAILENLS
jgi:hypothetical protein